MEVILIKALQLMLSLSILVLLHEGGHMFFARLFGIRVEKFYLFFDPWFHLFEWKPKHSHTTYGIGWLPLGGYCKIAGMIDESMDKEQMKQPPKPWEFRTKPAWQRLLVMIGGVLVNFLLALFIYSMIEFHWGEDYIPAEKMTMGYQFNDEAKKLGFRDGDIIVGTDIKPLKSFYSDAGDFYRTISNATRIDVIRNGKKIAIKSNGDLNLLDMIKDTPRFLMPIIPADVDSVMAGTPAAKVGMKEGARLTAMNGKPINSWYDFDNIKGVQDDIMAAAKTHSDSLKARTVTVSFRQKGSDSVITARMVLTPDMMLGIGRSTPLDYYKEVHQSYGFFESFPAGIKYGWNVLKGYVSDMKYVATADGAKSLGGFGALGSLFPSVWNWYLFWKMTAFLSIILAFMNILPIPALDGGHVLFLLYEMITGRKPSDRFMEIAEYIGISVLLLLLVVANLNDILRALGLM